MPIQIPLTFTPQTEFVREVGYGSVAGTWALPLTLKIAPGFYRRRLYVWLDWDTAVMVGWVIYADLVFLRGQREMARLPFYRRQGSPPAGQFNIYPWSGGAGGTGHPGGIAVYMGTSPTLYQIAPFDLTVGADRLEVRPVQMTSAAAGVPVWFVGLLSMHQW